ncbi:MAG TPA: hypothetical protein VMT46_19560 [Anaerolineaceae bacterium]|nr:hypothetical protein [Anaerolineaceae bacterium]
MPVEDWKLDFELELQRAENARRSGNEGQARVCARRAAGLLSQQYLRTLSIPFEGYSAYDLIAVLQEQPVLPEPAREILAHLRARVEPGGVFPLPVDLIAETRQLPALLGMVDEKPSNS